MSSHSNSPKNTSLMGMNIKNQIAFNEDSLKSEKKVDLISLCHYCHINKPQNILCKQCNRIFCIDCYKLLYNNKEAPIKNLTSNSEKQNWICFICNNSCPCEACKSIKPEKIDKKCTLSEDKIKNINTIEKQKDELITQNNNNPISLLLKENISNDNTIIFKQTSNSNPLIANNNFTNGESENLHCLSDKKTDKINDRKINTLDNNKKDDIKENNKNKINNGNILSLENGAQNLFNHNQQLNQLNQVNQPFINFYPNPAQLIIKNQQLNDFQKNAELLGFPLKNGDNFFNQSFHNINFPPHQTNIQDNNKQIGQIIQDKNTQNPQMLPAQKLTDFLAKIIESFQNFIEYNTQNALNANNNAMQLKEILKSILKENQKDEDKKDSQQSSLNQIITFLITVVDNLIAKIKYIYSNSQTSKSFVRTITKNLEQFIEQMNSQQAMTDFQKTQQQMFFNSFNPLTMQSPYSVMNGQGVNDYIKSMQYSNMNQNPMMNDIMKSQFQLNPQMLQGGITGMQLMWIPPPMYGVRNLQQPNTTPIEGNPNIIGVTGMSNIPNITGIPNVKNMMNFMQNNKTN